MANNLEINVNVNPQLNDGKLNEINSKIKSTLEMSGGTVTIASDTSKLQSDLTDVSNKAQDTLKNAGNQAGKGFTENLGKSLSGVQNVFQNMMGTILGVFGGNVLTKGVSGIVGSFEGLIEKGKASLMATQNLSIAFAQAGKSGKELQAAIGETAKFAGELSNKYAMSVAQVRQFSQSAASLTGATGQQNKDLTQLAIGIEKASNGMVSGEMAIRLFGKGVSDPESQFAMQRLTKQFPALGAAMKGIKDPSEATTAALQFFAPTFKEMENQANGPIGSMQRLENSLNMIKSSIGKLIVEAVAPFIQAFANMLMPAVQRVMTFINGLKPLIEPLKPLFVGLGAAVGVAAIALTALSAGNYFMGMINQAGTFAAQIIKTVIPSLYAQGIAADTNTFSFATMWATALAPATLVIAALALVGLALVLLYKYVQPVKDYFDKTWAVIKAGALAIWEVLKGMAEGIWKLFTGDFSGAIESFSNIGAKAGGAFKDSLNDSLDNIEWEKAKTNLDDAFKKGVEISAKVNSQEALKGFINDYADAKKQIDELNAKQASGGLTQDETLNLEQLKTKAQQTASEIAKIAPATKANISTIIDANGNITETYDINIAKAKEFANSTANNDALKKSANDYSQALSKQVDVMNEQVNRQKDLKAQIDRTSSPELRDALMKRYNEENQAIEKNKNSIIASYTEGGKASLLTNEAFEKLGKTLNITGEQARQMLLSKELEEAGKNGSITDAQIGAIAQKYGKTFDEAKKIVVEQQKITAETQKSKEAAMGWGDAVSDIGKKQKEAQEAIAKAMLERKKGNITEEEYNRQITEGNKKLKEANKDAAERTAIAKEFNKHAEYQAVKVDELGKQETKQAKQAKESKEQLLDKYDIMVKTNQKNLENLKTQAEIEAAQKGMKLTDQQSLAFAQIDLNNKKKQLDLLKEIVKEKGGAVNIDSQGLMTIDWGKSKLDSKGKEKLNDELEKAAVELNKSKLAGVQLEGKINIDEVQLKKDIAKLEYESAKINIEAGIKIGVNVESDLAKLELEHLASQVEDAQKEINKYSFFSEYADPKKLKEAQNNMASLTLKQGELQSKYSNLQQKEKLQLIEDTNKREKELAIFDLQTKYSQEVLLTRGNEGAKFALWSEFQKKKLDIEEEYNKKVESSTNSVFKNLGAALTQSFANFKIELPKSSATREVEAVKKSQEELKKQYDSGEIVYNNYIEKQNELDKKREEAANKHSVVMGAIFKSLNSALAQSIQKTIDTLQKQLDDSMKEIGETQKLLLQSNKEYNDAKNNSDIAGMMEADKTRGELNEKQLKAEQTFYSSLTAQQSMYAAQMLVQGKSFWKAMALAALGALKTMIPIWSAQLFGFSMIDSWGNIAVALLKQAAFVVTMESLVAVAQNAINGYWTGGLIGGGEQLVRVNEKGQEFIFNALTTAKNLKAFELMNKENLSVDEYAGKYLSTDKLMNTHVFVNESRALREELVNTQLEINRLGKKFRQNTAIDISVKSDKNALIREVEILQERELRRA